MISEKKKKIVAIGMETTDVFIENYIFFSLGINYLDFLNM